MPSEQAPTEFERTVLPFLQDCYAFAMSLARHAAAAEDLVQETFLRAQRSFQTFEPGTNAKAWLFTILRRLHIDRHRRSRMHALLSPPEEMEALAPYEDPEEADYEGVTGAQVMAALERVPEAFRLAVRLRDVDGLSYAEIGRVLDVPPGTVMSRIHRGREWLRRLVVAPSNDLVPDEPGPPGTSPPPGDPPA